MYISVLHYSIHNCKTTPLHSERSCWQLKVRVIALQQMCNYSLLFLLLLCLLLLLFHFLFLHLLLLFLFPPSSSSLTHFDVVVQSPTYVYHMRKGGACSGRRGGVKQHKLVSPCLANKDLSWALWL